MCQLTQGPHHLVYGWCHPTMSLYSGKEEVPLVACLSFFYISMLMPFLRLPSSWSNKPRHPSPNIVTLEFQYLSIRETKIGIQFVANAIRSTLKMFHLSSQTNHEGKLSQCVMWEKAKPGQMRMFRMRVLKLRQGSCWNCTFRLARLNKRQKGGIQAEGVPAFLL